MDGDLPGKIEAVARKLFGDPNQRLSSPTELRFGNNGSLRVTIGGDHCGTWRDHEADAGGGVLDLVVHSRGGDHKAAARWISQEIDNHSASSDRQIIATYSYTDWAGVTIHEVVRYHPKEFRQRRPDGKGGFIWNMKGVPPLLYNMPAVVDATGSQGLVFVVEGEKDADRLNALGLVATCNAGGAGKWKVEHSRQLSGARVAIIPDNDDAGRAHAEDVATALREGNSDIRLVELGLENRKADVSDWLDAGGTPEQLLALVSAAPQWRPAFKPRFPIVWFGQEDSGPQLRWLVRGLLVSGGLSVFYGAPKSTKTFAALDLALNVAHGRNWFGLSVHPAGVVYICGEGVAGVRQRMKAWRSEFDGAPAAPFALIPQSIDMFGDDDEVDRLIADVKGIGEPMGCPVGLVVLDTLSRMIGAGDEDKARDVNIVVRSAERIQRLTGAHVLIVHHSGKDRDRGMRGSNALLGAVDAAIEVTKDADNGLCEAKVTAIKDGGDVGPFTYTLRQTAVGEDDDGEPILSCVIDPAGARQGGVRPGLTDPERRALNILREIVGDIQDTAGQLLKVPIGTWRDKIKSRENGTPDAVKKRVERSTKSLIDKRYVEAGYDQVWLPEGDL